MDELNDLMTSNKTELIGSLDGYQGEIINSFLDMSSGNYLVSVDKWLNANTANTVPFGGDSSKVKIYRDKLLDELEKFLCGDKSYEEDRKKIKASADKSKQYIIGVMSTAIGKTLGTAGTFIAPVIVLFLLSFGSMALNAWCEMRKEIKEN